MPNTYYYNLYLDNANPGDAERIFEDSKAKNGWIYSYFGSPVNGSFLSVNSIYKIDVIHEMIPLSIQYPHILFELNEEDDDRYVANHYFQDGEMQTCVGEIVVPEYNPSLMHLPNEPQPEPEPEYADICWRPSEVQIIAQKLGVTLTWEEAADWLHTNQNTIRAAMYNAGRATLESIDWSKVNRSTQ